MRIEGTNLLLFNQIHASHCFIFKNDYDFMWTKRFPELRKKIIKLHDRVGRTEQSLMNVQPVKRAFDIASY